MGEDSFLRLAPEEADVVVRLTEDELKVATEELEDDKADYEDAREDLLASLGIAGAAQREELQERVAALAAICAHQQQKVRDLRQNKRDLAKLRREKQAGGEGREAEALGGTEMSAPTQERSEDAGLGNVAGALRSPGPKGLQPVDRMERPDDVGRAQNAGGAEAPPLDVLQILQVSSAPAEARDETQDAGDGNEARGSTQVPRQGAEAGDGTDGSAPTQERSEDAGLGNGAGAPRSPGPKGLQPVDRMERPEDGGRAQNAGGAEALPREEVLTPVLQVPSTPAEARGEGRNTEEVLLAAAVEESRGPEPPTEEGARHGQAHRPRSTEKSPPGGSEAGGLDLGPMDRANPEDEETIEQAMIEEEEALAALDELAAQGSAEPELAADEPMVEGGSGLHPWLPSPGGNPTPARMMMAQRARTRWLEVVERYPEGRKFELEQQKISEMILDNAVHEARGQAIYLGDQVRDYRGAKHQWREIGRCDVSERLRGTCKFKVNQMTRRIAEDAAAGRKTPKYTYPRFLAPLGRSDCRPLRPARYGRPPSNADAALMVRHLQYATAEQGVQQAAGVGEFLVHHPQYPDAAAVLQSIADLEQAGGREFWTNEELRARTYPREREPDGPASPLPNLLGGGDPNARGSPDMDRSEEAVSAMEAFSEGADDQGSAVWRETEMPGAGVKSFSRMVTLAEYRESRAQSDAWTQEEVARAAATPENLDGIHAGAAYSPEAAASPRGLIREVLSHTPPAEEKEPTSAVVADKDEGGAVPEVSADRRPSARADGLPFSKILEVQVGVDGPQVCDVPDLSVPGGQTIPEVEPTPAPAAMLGQVGVSGPQVGDVLDLSVPGGQTIPEVEPAPAPAAMSGQGGVPGPQVGEVLDPSVSCGQASSEIELAPTPATVSGKTKLQGSGPTAGRGSGPPDCSAPVLLGLLRSAHFDGGLTRGGQGRAQEYSEHLAEGPPGTPDEPRWKRSETGPWEEVTEEDRAEAAARAAEADVRRCEALAAESERCRDESARQAHDARAAAEKHRRALKKARGQRIEAARMERDANAARRKEEAAEDERRLWAAMEEGPEPEPSSEPEHQPSSFGQSGAMSEAGAAAEEQERCRLAKEAQEMVEAGRRATEEVQLLAEAAAARVEADEAEAAQVLAASEALASQETQARRRVEKLKANIAAALAGREETQEKLRRATRVRDAKSAEVLAAAKEHQVRIRRFTEASTAEMAEMQPELAEHLRYQMGVGRSQAAAKKEVHTLDAQLRAYALEWEGLTDVLRAEKIGDHPPAPLYFNSGALDEEVVSPDSRARFEARCEMTSLRMSARGPGLVDEHGRVWPTHEHFACGLKLGWSPDGGAAAQEAIRTGCDTLPEVRQHADPPGWHTRGMSRGELERTPMEAAVWEGVVRKFGPPGEARTALLATARRSLICHTPVGGEVGHDPVLGDGGVRGWVPGSSGNTFGRLLMEFRAMTRADGPRGVPEVTVPRTGPDVAVWEADGGAEFRSDQLLQAAEEALIQPTDRPMAFCLAVENEEGTVDSFVMVFDEETGEARFPWVTSHREIAFQSQGGPGPDGQAQYMALFDDQTAMELQQLLDCLGLVADEGVGARLLGYGTRWTREGEDGIPPAPDGLQHRSETVLEPVMYLVVRAVPTPGSPGPLQAKSPFTAGDRWNNACKGSGGHGSDLNRTTVWGQMVPTANGVLGAAAPTGVDEMVFACPRLVVHFPIERFGKLGSVPFGGAGLPACRHGEHSTDGERSGSGVVRFNGDQAQARAVVHALMGGQHPVGIAGHLSAAGMRAPMARGMRSWGDSLDVTNTHGQITPGMRVRLLENVTQSFQDEAQALGLTGIDNGCTLKSQWNRALPPQSSMSGQLLDLGAVLVAALGDLRGTVADGRAVVPGLMALRWKQCEEDADRYRASRASLGMMVLGRVRRILEAFRDRGRVSDSGWGSTSGTEWSQLHAVIRDGRACAERVVLRSQELAEACRRERVMAAVEGGDLVLELQSQAALHTAMAFHARQQAEMDVEVNDRAGSLCGLMLADAGRSIPAHLQSEDGDVWRQWLGVPKLDADGLEERFEGILGPVREASRPGAVSDEWKFLWQDMASRLTFWVGGVPSGYLCHPVTRWATRVSDVCQGYLCEELHGVYWTSVTGCLRNEVAGGVDDSNADERGPFRPAFRSAKALGATPKETRCMRFPVVLPVFQEDSPGTVACYQLVPLPVGAPLWANHLVRVSSQSNEIPIDWHMAARVQYENNSTAAWLQRAADPLVSFKHGSAAGHRAHMDGNVGGPFYRSVLRSLRVRAEERINTVGSSNGSPRGRNREERRVPTEPKAPRQRGLRGPVCDADSRRGVGLCDVVDIYVHGGSHRMTSAESAPVLTCRVRREKAMSELDGVLDGTVFKSWRCTPWCLRHGNPQGGVTDASWGDGRPGSVLSLGLSARRCPAAVSLLLAAPPKEARTPVAAALRGEALLQAVAARVVPDTGPHNEGAWRQFSSWGTVQACQTTQARYLSFVMRFWGGVAPALVENADVFVAGGHWSFDDAQVGDDLGDGRERGQEAVPDSETTDHTVATRGAECATPTAAGRSPEPPSTVSFRQGLVGRALHVDRRSALMALGCTASELLHIDSADDVDVAALAQIGTLMELGRQDARWSCGNPWCREKRDADDDEELWAERVEARKDPMKRDGITGPSVYCCQACTAVGLSWWIEGSPGPSAGEGGSRRGGGGSDGGDSGEGGPSSGGGGGSASTTGGTPPQSGEGASGGNTLSDSEAGAAGVGQVETIDDSGVMAALEAGESDRGEVKQSEVGQCGICATSGPVTETEELMAGMMNRVMEGRKETELCDPCAEAVRGLYANREHVEAPTAVAAGSTPSRLTCRVCTTAAALNQAGLCVGSCESDAERIRRIEIKGRCRVYRSDDPQQRWSDVEEGMAVVDELSGVLSELGDIGAGLGEDATGPQWIQALVGAVGKMRKPPPEVMEMLERYGESAAVHDEAVGVEVSDEVHLHVCDTLGRRMSNRREYVDRRACGEAEDGLIVSQGGLHWDRHVPGAGALREARERELGLHDVDTCEARADCTFCHAEGMCSSKHVERWDTTEAWGRLPCTHCEAERDREMEDLEGHGDVLGIRVEKVPAPPYPEDVPGYPGTAGKERLIRSSSRTRRPTDGVIRKAFDEKIKPTMVKGADGKVRKMRRIQPRFAINWGVSPEQAITAVWRLKVLDADGELNEMLAAPSTDPDVGTLFMNTEGTAAEHELVIVPGHECEGKVQRLVGRRKGRTKVSAEVGEADRAEAAAEPTPPSVTSPAGLTPGLEQQGLELLGHLLSHHNPVEDLGLDVSLDQKHAEVSEAKKGVDRALQAQLEDGANRSSINPRARASACKAVTRRRRQGLRTAVEEFYKGCLGPEGGDLLFDVDRVVGSKKALNLRTRSGPGKGVAYKPVTPGGDREDHRQMESSWCEDASICEESIRWALNATLDSNMSEADSVLGNMVLDQTYSISREEAEGSPSSDEGSGHEEDSDSDEDAVRRGWRPKRGGGECAMARPLGAKKICAALIQPEGMTPDEDATWRLGLRRKAYFRLTDMGLRLDEQFVDACLRESAFRGKPSDDVHRPTLPKVMKKVREAVTAYPRIWSETAGGHREDWAIWFVRDIWPQLEDMCINYMMVALPYLVEACQELKVFPEAAVKWHKEKVLEWIRDTNRDNPKERLSPWVRGEKDATGEVLIPSFKERCPSDLDTMERHIKKKSGRFIYLPTSRMKFGNEQTVWFELILKSAELQYHDSPFRSEWEHSMDQPGGLADATSITFIPEKTWLVEADGPRQVIEGLARWATRRNNPPNPTQTIYWYLYQMHWSVAKKLWSSYADNQWMVSRHVTGATTEDLEMVEMMWEQTHLRYHGTDKLESPPIRGGDKYRLDLKGSGKGSSGTGSWARSGPFEWNRRSKQLSNGPKGRLALSKSPAAVGKRFFAKVRLAHSHNPESRGAEPYDALMAANPLVLDDGGKAIGTVRRIEWDEDDGSPIPELDEDSPPVERQGEGPYNQGSYQGPWVEGGPELYGGPKGMFSEFTLRRARLEAGAKPDVAAVKTWVERVVANPRAGKPPTGLTAVTAKQVVKKLAGAPVMGRLPSQLAAAPGHTCRPGACPDCAATDWGKTFNHRTSCKQCEAHCWDTCALRDAEEVLGKALCDTLSKEILCTIIFYAYPGSRDKPFGNDEARNRAQRARVKAWTQANKDKAPANYGKALQEWRTAGS